MSVRNTISVISAFAFMAVMLTAAGGARAESLGPYVHGQLRVDDENVYLCSEDSAAFAVAIATGLNDYVLNGRNKESAGYKELLRLVKKAKVEKKCFKIVKMTHRSVRTIYQGPESLLELGARHSVVETRFKIDGDDYIAFVFTGEEVPPVE